MSVFNLGPRYVPEITPEIDRRNGWLFAGTQVLVYFSAPVLYVGIVQAAFCDKLGASATISNLPSATYFLGYIFPFISSWFFAPKWEKGVAQISLLTVSISMLLVCVVTFLPFPSWLRIGVVIGQGFLIGTSNSLTNIYLFKCLARGTTALGKVRALKYAFGLGPIAAVLGSLGAQYVLAGKISWLQYPFTFGALYLITFPCILLCSVLTSRYQLLEVPADNHPPFFIYLLASINSFRLDQRLVLTWLAYLAWYFTITAMANISLYTKEAVGRSPLELAGLILAIRFSSKAMAGFLFGNLASRYGERLTMITTVVCTGAAILWPLFASGYEYLLSFGLMGAGELGGVYFMAYVLTISSASTATRNLALLSLAAPISSLGPVIHGGLTDRFGFQASFVFGTVTAGISLLLLLKLKRDPDGH